MGVKKIRNAERELLSDLTSSWISELGEIDSITSIPASSQGAFFSEAAVKLDNIRNPYGDEK